MAALNQRVVFFKSGRVSSVGPEILAFGSHCSANFLPSLAYFIPNFTLRYGDLENIKQIVCCFQLTSNQTEELVWYTR